MARVLIAGCGYVGAALGRALAARGDRVLALRRDPAGLPPELETVAADLGDPATLGVLRAPVEPFDAVVYAAAPPGRDQDAYDLVYRRGVANLLAAVEASGRSGGVPLFVLLSSTGVYGQDRGERVDESSPTSPPDFRGRLVLAGEALARAAPARALVLRLGGIYGPGRASLLAAVRAGETSAPGPARYVNRIHRDDVVAATLHLMARALRPPATATPARGGARAGGESDTYLLVDDRPASRAEVIGWIAGRLGVAASPDAGATAAGALGKRCSNRKLARTGYQLLYPTYREGYGALLEDPPRDHGPDGSAPVLPPRRDREA